MSGEDTVGRAVSRDWMRRFGVPTVATVLLLTLLGAGPSVNAYPEHVIQVSQIAEKKKAAVAYVEYEEGELVDEGWFDAGRLRLEATPFKVEESMGSLDQYLLNLQVRLPKKHKKGMHDDAWAHISVRTKKAGKVNLIAATRSRKVNRKCAGVNLSLNASFGPIGLGTSTGKMRACRHARQRLFSVNKKTGSASWRLESLKHLKRTELELYLEVPAGKRPRFIVTIERPVDDCVAVKYAPPTQCRPTSREATATLKVPTKQ